MLTNPAVKTRPLSLLDLQNFCTAGSTRFMRASIDEILLLEVAAAAVAVDEIAQRAAAFCYGRVQGGADFNH